MPLLVAFTERAVLAEPAVPSVITPVGEAFVPPAAAFSEIVPPEPEVVAFTVISALGLGNVIPPVPLFVMVMDPPLPDVLPPFAVMVPNAPFAPGLVALPETVNGVELFDMSLIIPPFPVPAPLASKVIAVLEPIRRLPVPLDPAVKVIDPPFPLPVPGGATVRKPDCPETVRLPPDVTLMVPPLPDVLPPVALRARALAPIFRVLFPI